MSYIPLTSPNLTGNPTAPTASTGDNDTSVANTAFVQQELNNNLLYFSSDFTGLGTNSVPIGITPTYFSNQFSGLGTSGNPISLTTDPSSKQNILISGTNIKTINNTSLLGSGDLTVQATLVSGTNIKTINGTSLLGSGDITITGGGSQTPWSSNIDGGQYNLSNVKQVQVSVVSTASENLLLYSEVLSNAAWGSNSIGLTDNQSNDVSGNNTMELVNILASGNYISQSVTVTPSTTYYVSWDVKRGTSTDIAYAIYDATNFNFITPSTSYYSSTSGVAQRVSFSFTTASNTTSIGIQPIAGVAVTGTCYIGRVQLATSGAATYTTTTSSSVSSGGGTVEVIYTDSSGSVGIGATTINAAAKLQIDSTTKGFLLPRMTTTQKNAISSPPAGLMIYDITLGKMCFRAASAWETITSS